VDHDAAGFIQDSTDSGTKQVDCVTAIRAAHQINREPPDSVA
jgi:hypothetical protein